MADEAPKGYNCTTCGKHHEFPAYVYAHWREVLAHECDGCGAKHEIVLGNAKLVAPGKAPNAA